MILSRILDHKKSELRRKQNRGYLSSMKTRITDQPAPLGFIHALEAGHSEAAPALIAEVKKASPSQGLMRPEFKDGFDPVAIAQQYREAGAHALSVLTDQEFFQGSLDFLAAVKKSVALPTLNKEFMVGDIQFYEARAHGADCVLLIVAGLDRIQLEDFFVLATGLHLDVLIETHNEQELDTVLERIPTAKLIGINNRDLKTFSTDLGVTERLAKRIPSDKLIVSESGIHKRDNVVKIFEAGARAMLIGESLLRANSIEEKIRELLPTTITSTEEPAGSRWV
ncbi:MAG: indole-3-glycerol phosphate synthase TrpC [Nitrospirota bacterium]|nr:indole-3-glycerol phosphate synthase TrpC [Nitrospirota bacterium]MDH5586283.1 indole-3-glycerol phosphate synthase TrpC [Nitrospirota bacterium]MDH5774822.1 indole-3-glycerol phosphate synthase TrpC [Nitrospirota bacterium]